ncbi:prostaglandin reductase [Aureococcus anophagefferens]|nr:prostaglandin reductase [Aureococcus anophagefferens]
MGKGGVYAPKGEIPEYAEAFKNAGYGTSGNSKDVEARVVHQKGKPIKGQPEEGDFAVGAVTVKELGVAEVRVKTRWCSVDPYMKFPMRAPVPPTEPAGGANCGECVGEVLESECIGFKPGDIVRGRWGWGDVRNIHGADLQLRTIHDGRPSTALGVLGMPGRTAYFGLFNILKPEPGQTIFISGGAGCVGSCVAQMAKAKGCKVYGSTTHASKVAWMEPLLVEEEEAEDYLAAMIDAGTLKYEEDIVVGDLDVPDAFCRLFHGSNHGKMLVKLDPKIGAENKVKKAADMAERKKRALDDEEMKRRDALLKDKQTAAWFADRAKRANEAWQAEVDDFMGPAKE